jgi:hypothetical protein
MSCSADNYKSAWVAVIDWSSQELENLTQVFWNKFLAIALVFILMTPVALAFTYATKIFVPKLAKWYLDQTITQKAREYYSRHCRGLGFKHSTATISIALGAAYYILIRVAVAFPSHYIWGILGLIVAFFAVHAVGCFVSGRVPVRSRNKYFKRFQSPTVTGLGLAVGTIALDFMINGATVVLSLLLDYLA